MIVNLNPIAANLTFYPVHGEWNVRDLRLQRLWGGRTLASWTFRDDGVALNDRKRHPAIPFSIVIPDHANLTALKMQLYYWLETVKKWIA